MTSPEDVETESVEEPDDGRVVPAFNEDDLREHFEPADIDEPEPVEQSDESEQPEQFDESDEPEQFDEPDEQPAQPDPVPSDTIDIGGTTYLLSDVQQQLEWARSLTPDQAARVAAALIDPPAAPAAPAAAPQAPVEPEPATRFDPEEFVDPQLAEYVAEQLAARDAEIERLRAAEEQRASVEFENQQQFIEAGWVVSRDAIAAEYELSNVEMAELTSTMERSGIVAFLAQRDGITNPEALFRVAYEQTYWTTPEFRDRAVARTAQQSANEAAAVAAEQAAAAVQAQQDRKTRAAALTGGGGTPPSRQPAPAPSSSQDRLSALAEGIRQSMSHN
jgi:hypothetical protein